MILKYLLSERRAKSEHLRLPLTADQKRLLRHDIRELSRHIKAIRKIMT